MRVPAGKSMEKYLTGTGFERVAAAKKRNNAGKGSSEFAARQGAGGQVTLTD